MKKRSLIIVSTVLIIVSVGIMLMLVDDGAAFLRLGEISTE